MSASGKKRFATIVVTSNSDVDWEQPPIGIIVRGSNKILEKEMHGYHPDVRVQFNEKVFLREYLERQCFKWLEEDGSCESLLFLDSLDAHRRRAFVFACHEHQCFPVYGPPGRTLVFLNSS